MARAADYSTTFSIPYELWVRLKEVSKAEGEPMSKLVCPVIVPAITKLLDELEAKHAASAKRD